MIKNLFLNTPYVGLFLIIVGAIYSVLVAGPAYNGDWSNEQVINFWIYIAGIIQIIVYVIPRTFK